MWLTLWSGTSIAANVLVGPNRTIQTLQDAVDVASNGDRIIVDAGAYDGCQVLARDLTIQAREPGTVRVATAIGSVFQVHHSNLALVGLEIDGTNVVRGLDSDTSTVNLRDVVVRNGVSTGRGGGVHAINSTVRVRGSEFLANTANDRGGHAYFTNSTVEISDSTFEDGLAVGFGGAVATINSEVDVHSSVFTDNEVLQEADARGGALHFDGGTVAIYASLFERNACQGDLGRGGAVWSDASVLWIGDTRFEENRAPDGGGFGAVGATVVARRIIARTNGLAVGATVQSWGGGAAFWGSDAIVADSMFEGNRSENGGGLFGDLGDVQLQRNLVCENTGLARGAGLFFWGSDPVVLENNIIAGNQNTGPWGGGVYLNRPNGTFHNNTIVGNTSTGMGSGLGVFWDSSAPVLVTRSNVFVENVSPDAFYGESDPAVGGSGVFTEHDVIHDNAAPMYPGTLIYEAGLSTTDPGFVVSGCDVFGLATDGGPLVGLGHPDRPDVGGGSTPGAFGGPEPAGWLVDVDGDGVSDSMDCDATSPDVFLGAVEICDGLDNDCDGLVDESDPGLVAPAAFPDADGDGAGDAFGGRPMCTVPPGWQSVSGDCDDADASVQGGLWRVDLDGDGFAAGAVVTSCAEVVPSDYVPASQPEDCDDTDPDISPGADEVCDGWDNDCDGAVDQADVSLDLTSLLNAYDDVDGDGLGDPSTQAQTCAIGSGQVGVPGDCDDADAAVGGPVSGFEDFDGDGFGTVSIVACPGPGVAVADGDCDDTEPAAYPGAPEVCDGVDNDCDDLVDLDDSDTVASTWYADVDQDGFGATDDALEACDGPVGYVLESGDCDDTNPEVYPGAPDDPADGMDTDCDGQPEEVVHPDADADGVVDVADPSPSNGDVLGGGDTPEPAYGCGCATAPVPTWSWARRR